MEITVTLESGKIWILGTIQPNDAVMKTTSITLPPGARAGIAEGNAFDLSTTSRHPLLAEVSDGQLLPRWSSTDPFVWATADTFEFIVDQFTVD